MATPLGRLPCGLRRTGRSDGTKDLVSVAKLGARCITLRTFGSIGTSQRLIAVAETGISPAKAIESLRLEAARLMLEQGRLPIEEIAHETGFGDRERMRRSFVRVFGQSPQSVRNGSPPLASF